MIISTFADDPDMIELVEEFVNELPKRIETLCSAFENGQVDQVRVIAHQLKGSSGGYGFAPVGDAAGELEAAVQDLGQESLESVRRELDELVSICSRVAVR